MAGIKHIRELLDNYPEIKYKSTDLNISVLPVDETGFKVNFVMHAEGITVYYDGWRKEFQIFEDAFHCFVNGLSRMYRLNVSACGNSKYKWRLESNKDDRWAKESELSLFIYPFWRKKREFILQNHYIKDSDQLNEIINRFRSIIE